MFVKKMCTPQKYILFTDILLTDYICPDLLYLQLLVRKCNLITEISDLYTIRLLNTYVCYLITSLARQRTINTKL